MSGSPATSGVVERTERLILVLVGTGFPGLGHPVRAARGAVDPAGGQRGHRRPALPRRPPGRSRTCCASRAMSDAPPRRRSRPAAGLRSRLTARLTDAGFAAGLGRGEAPAGAGGPSGVRRRRPLGGRPGRPGRAPAAREPAGRHRRPAERAGARRPHPPGGAVLRPLLAGGLPAAGARSPAGSSGAPSSPARARRPRPRRRAADRLRPAAQRQLGRRRGLAGRLARRPVHDRRRAARAGVALRAVRRLPGVPRHPGRAAHRRPAAQHRGAQGLAGRRRHRLPAGRPGPRARPASRSTFFGRAATLPGRAGAARRADRGRARPGRLLVHRHGVAAGVPPGGSRRGARPAAGPRGDGDAGRRRRVHGRRSRERPEDWHMLGPDLGRRAARPAARTRGEPA